MNSYDAPVLDVRNVSKSFQASDGSHVYAVKDVSFALAAGESLGIFGESGAGKSTLGRIALGLLRPDSGAVVFRGKNVHELSPAQLRRQRADLQVVFQEPFQSLDPLWTVRRIVSEPLDIHERSLTREQREARIRHCIGLAGLTDELLDRRPSELSGGQQQRVGIARAIATNPVMLVLDEPTSSLDVTVRARILRTFAQLRRETGLSYLLISHDLSTIRSISTRVAVLYKGRIVEQGATGQVFDDPQDPYTKRLLSARIALNDLAR